MLKNRATLLVALPLLVVGLAGCSADGGADSPTPKTESQITADAKAWDVANASCMRAAGIDVGDPSEGEGAGISVDEDTDFAAVQAASEKCREETVDELGERPVTAAEKKSQEGFEEKLRESNECLRDKGYDAPDPKEGNGGVVFSEGLDQDIPEDVLEACGALSSGFATSTEER